ncbi:MAG: hypothetical protein JNM93_10505 [Bacteriovoracaceae bacterium]|nr:hypothetical protein [Bacteriovoracaceae bacterium]
MSVKCFRCQKELDYKAGQKVARNEDCEFCSFDLHSCKMCIFYEKSAYNECRESNAERVTEKEKANFCDYFQIGSNENAQAKKNELLNAASALFKK